MLSVATPLGSPVAGVFLLLAWLAVAIHARHRRSAMARALVLAAATLAPLAVLGGAFPEAGRFPFRMAAWALTVAACAAAYWLPQSLGPVRIGAGLYAVAATLTFVLANPLGANVTRLGMFVARPAPRSHGDLLASSAGPARRPAAVVAVVAGGRRGRAERKRSVDGEGVLPAAPRRAGPARPAGRPHRDPTHPAPLRDGLRRAGRAHRPRRQRQLDIAVNGLFYRDGPLRPADYYRWLLDNGVRYVALPDAPFDEAAEAEAELLKTGPSFLTPVWADAHWRLWRVAGADGLVDGPAALVAQTPETVVLDASSPGDVVVRVHASALWSVDGPACVEPTGGEWVHLQVRAPGRLELHPVLLGSRNRCPD